jgi:hypothetical protein
MTAIWWRQTASSHFIGFFRITGMECCGSSHSNRIVVVVVAVVVGECRTNDDCSYDRYCDTVAYQCVPVCQTQICGKLASCTAVDHSAICSCLEGYVGNPRDECRERELILKSILSPINFKLTLN